jgi:hypothetical protein
MIKLITLLVAGIPAIIAAVLAQLGRKWVTVAAAIALAVSLTAGFVALINTLVGSLASLLSAPGWISNAVGMFIPADFGLCVAAIVSAHIARAAYDFAIGKVKLFNTGT